jgi:2'-5' RNA ligase
MRLFIAAPLPESAERQLAGIIEEFRPLGGGVKWVEAGNIHLTLRFLGETEERLVGPLSELLSRLTAGLAPVATAIDRLGGFPNLRKPRVIWVSMSEGTDPLAKLAANLELGVQQMGFEAETKRFKPHLTLGRVKRPDGLERLVDRLERHRLSPISVHLDRAVLFQSTLTPRGPIYQRLHEAPFAAH